MANRLLAAAYSDADIGEQLSLFLDGDRTPAADRAYKEGQTSAMKNEAAVPKYAPDTDQYAAFMQGYHDEQGRQVKAGIGKLDAKKPGRAAKTAKVAKPKGKRGRPPKPKGPNAEPPAGSERTLIPKAEKEAKAVARAPKATDAPPRRPTVQPVTRTTLAAQKAAQREEADSYFSKAEPKGNA